MKYISEYRNPEIAKKLINRINALLDNHKSELTFMEVCGTHTMSIARCGIKKIFDGKISMLSGPGCPVCVTHNEYLDRAIAFSRRDDVILTTFGDMMKVPGSSSSLYREKADGADIRMLYSPLDALKIAKENPLKKIIFLGVGFETTTPVIAATLEIAKQKNVKNFFVYSGHKIVPPALHALVNDPELKLDGFLCPGHVSAIIGTEPYEFIARDHDLHCVIAGFEPLDILHSLLMLVTPIVEGKKASVEIQYSRVVKKEGNPGAVSMMNKIFKAADIAWRGIGIIPESGLIFRENFSSMDAEKNIPVEVEECIEHKGCICGEILRGIKNPTECPLYKKTCNPEHPVGACMVSSEGTCAAWYKYE
jgi:hydrogenase expression/formation protein HypD